MDIYRFFHPHHNPRLHNTPLRQQEISELEQAASELRKALDRAQQRTQRQPVSPIMAGHFTDIIKAMRFVETSLQTLCDAHPGDTQPGMLDLISERCEFTGWEAWVSLLREQLSFPGAFSDSSEISSATGEHDSSDDGKSTEKKSSENKQFTDRKPIPNVGI